MLSDTLTNELGRYAIGPRIKALRLRKKLGLVQLAAHTGLSSAMLSKIERGQMFPTLPTLLRIAMVFGVGLDHFFSPEQGEAASRGGTEGTAAQASRTAGREAARLSIRKPGLSRRQPHVWRLSMPSFHSTHCHRIRTSMAAWSSFTCLGGRVVVDVVGEQTTLNAGDAMYFDSSVPHSYRRDGKEVCTALVVTAH